MVDLGGGRFAFYAHLQKGSLKVRPGDRVRRGEVIARLGNSGNTSAPHLHFHIVDNASVLGSDGLPYVIDRFDVRGEIDRNGSLPPRRSRATMATASRPAPAIAPGNFRSIYRSSTFLAAEALARPPFHSPGGARWQAHDHP